MYFWDLRSEFKNEIIKVDLKKKYGKTLVSHKGTWIDLLYQDTLIERRSCYFLTWEEGE